MSQREVIDRIFLSVLTILTRPFTSPFSLSLSLPPFEPSGRAGLHSRSCQRAALHRQPRQHPLEGGGVRAGGNIIYMYLHAR